MRAVLKRLRRDQAGQDLAEYGIALALIVGVVALVAVAVGQSVQTLWVTGQSAVVQAANP